MNRIIGFISLLVLIASLYPQETFAQSCSSKGYTVIFVNGILNTLADAQESKQLLEAKLGTNLDAEPVNIQIGYNPSHLGGLGDKIESVTQAFANPVSDYDLYTILTQIQPEVTTQKILLVGHSQGSFYTDEMYDYLTTHGVPKESIAVYNIATPESFIGGGGGYLTSTNDKVINQVRDDENNGNLEIYLNSYYTHTQNVVSSALRANITLPKETGWDTDAYGGHHFAVYLDEGGNRIIGDIDRELANLKSDSSDSSDACFAAPMPTLADKVQSAVFAVSDPLVDTTSIAAGNISAGALALVGNTFNTLASLGSSLGFGASNNTSQAAVAVLATEAAPEKSVAEPPTVVPKETVITLAPKTIAAAQEPSTPKVPTQPHTQSATPTHQPSITPGFGGGGGGASDQSNPSQIQSNPSQNSSQQNNSIVVPLSVISPADGSAFATVSLTFFGTTTAGAVVTADSGTLSTSTTADGSGNWSLSIQLPEGTNSVSTSATSGGQTSPGDTRSVVVDLTPPVTPTISSSDCDGSLLASSCLVPTTTVNVGWNSASGASYYALATNGLPGATTTSLTAQALVANGVTASVAVIAYDDAGNAATSSALSVAVILQPLIINEIGWGGTDTAPTNQWIEIKNLTSQDLDLSHIVVMRSSGASIPLSGTLPAAINQNFLVVAPGDPRFFGAHVLTTTFSLATTSAEQLSLVWNGSTTLDATPATSTCSNWCFGSYDATLGTNVEGRPDFVTPLSMERKSNGDGTLASTWQSNDSYTGFPGASVNDDSWGTPGVDNSLGLPDAGVYCGSPSNLLVPSAPPGPSFSPGDDCVFLSRFITPGLFGAARFIGVFRGDVASSTGAGQHGALSFDLPVNIASQNPATGEHFFFAIWENRSFGTDPVDFDNYFTTGTPAPPHGNYVTIPFTFAP